MCSLLVFASNALAQGPSEEQSLWLHSKLYGSDNVYAALREVKITQEGSRFRVFIKNQFAFNCDLSFSAKGQPEKLTQCKSSEVVYNSGDESETTWKFDRDEIALRCRKGKTEVVCRGKANLDSGSPSTIGGFVQTKS